MIVPLKQSAHAHADLLNALLIAFRDGVRRQRIDPDKVEPLMRMASYSDCRVVRFMLEALLRETQ